MAGEIGNNLMAKLAGRIFPRTPDFYALLNEQCATLVDGTTSLVSFMRTGDEQHANRVRELEHAGDRLKARNLDVLHRAFSTPMDREDLFRDRATALGNLKDRIERRRIELDHRIHAARAVPVADEYEARARLRLAAPIGD